MVSTTSLSQRLGGLYCLYCLYETQPFKPQFKIYFSLEELQKLEKLVIEAKENGIFIVISVVKTMLKKHMFLFGYVDINEASLNQTVNQLTELQNARVKVACDKLFNDTRIDHFLDMDLGTEIDLKEIRDLSTGYEEAKKRAIGEASKEVDVQNAKHIVDNKEMMVDVLDKMSDDWYARREVFHQQARMNNQQHNKALVIQEGEKLDDEEQQFEWLQEELWQ
jgi:snRNA-activating protein complex subunit 1